MKTMVISLGGSVIVPEKPDYKYLELFKKTIIKNYSKCRFVVVCGGGSIARKYIEGLKAEKKSEKELSLAGIRATRMNAQFLMQLFGKQANDTLPMNMNQVKSNLHKNKIVICGALRYASNSTSDGTAAKLARFLNAEFINITNVPGLYTADPRKDKNAKLIPKINWQEFNKIISKIKFHAGQHFVLDQQASKIIKNNKIKTYIIQNPKEITKIIENKNFFGTKIS